MRNTPPPLRSNVTSDSDEEDSFYYGKASREKNYGFTEVKILDGNIAYLKLSEINISEKSLPVLELLHKKPHVLWLTHKSLEEMGHRLGTGSASGLELEFFERNAVVSGNPLSK